MSTKVKFGNKTIQLPGTYSRIISGQNNPPSNLDYGKLLIIDNSLLATLNEEVDEQSITGGSGINGENFSGKNSIYRFSDINSFRDFVAYGYWWKAAQFLFNPDGNGNGVSEVIVVKPATTTSAKANYFSYSNYSGRLEFKTKDEGVNTTGQTNNIKATSKTTVSAAGAAADTIAIKFLTEVIASYTIKTGDTIQNVVTGLVTSLGILGKELGFSLSTSDATSLTIAAPEGFGASLNTKTPITIVKTGTVAATAAAFAGGTDPGKLIRGYAYSIETGVKDTSKFIFKFWRGVFRGYYVDGLPYDGVSEGSSPELIAQSPEVSTLSELYDWCSKDSNFGSKFSVSTPLGIPLSTTILTIDVAMFASYVPFINGSEYYGSTDFDDMLEVIKDIDYNYIIYPANSPGIDEPNNLKLLNHIKLDAKYDKFMSIGVDSSYSVANTVIIATEYDSERVNLVYGSILERSKDISTGFREWSSFFHNCAVVGRILGLAPEVPATFKKLYIDGVKTPLTVKDREALDEAGVVCTVWDEDFKSYIILHDVNTLQDNDFVLTNEGKSHLIQVERIKSQLNKELVINAKLDLLSDPNGVNRSSLTKTDAIEWTKGYLQRKLGTLIVEYRNVTATVQGDVIFIDYEAMPNSEIKGIFFTGRIYL